jgi:hypothetical protein
VATRLGGSIGLSVPGVGFGADELTHGCCMKPYLASNGVSDC